ncbi:MAG TPA: hypothetical protein VEA69_20875 [Tepidisphaeraceae bacterium]|nr:hypothetical protein [Tepidisphaeraceae bacterium]
MTQTFAYARPVVPVVEHDRRKGLVAFGIISLVGALPAAGGTAVLTLLIAELLFWNAPVGALTFAVTSWAAFAGMTTLLIWGGIGSIRCRRWCRPVTLAVAWPCAVAGGLVLAGWLIALADFPTLVGRTRWSRSMVIEAVVLTGILVIGLGIAVAYAWFYSLATVRRTLEAYDPGPSWADRCPAPVAVLGACLIVGGLLTIALAVGVGRVPVFGTYVGELDGMGIAMLMGIALVAAGVGCFLRARLAWWAALVLVTGGFTSAIVTVAVRAPIEFYRQGGISGSGLTALASSPVMSGPTPVIFMCVTMGIAVGVLVETRRYFRDRGAVARR